ncbi:tyrosine-type recombinase/integrase [Peristeroidobacter soli]|uniref:tyrosine-type recombinase/integrase n=1 Tax=Peristeroidobacter soli TaxID=2497877 RepID=UPI00101C50BF|nr:site-specific integrase [Peristeroidobacter soli]
MPKRARELSARTVASLRGDGRYAVGLVPGLYLRIEGASRTWVLRVKRNGKRPERGLGSYPTVSLAAAREVAWALRKTRPQPAPAHPTGASALPTLQVLSASTKPDLGQPEPNPKTPANTAGDEGPITFEWCARTYVAAQEAGWKSKKHSKQWISTLEDYAFPVIGPLHPRDITLEHTLRILKPIWTTKTETATRVRGRIESILDWAEHRNHRSGKNPAGWKGNLQFELPSPTKLKKRKKRHHPALPYLRIGVFMADLRSRHGVSRRALEWGILTSTRSQEIRGARHSEINLQLKRWTIPKERMKLEKDHIVPLSDAAIELYKSLPRVDGCDLLFPAPEGGELSDATLCAVIDDMHEADLRRDGIGYMDPVQNRVATQHGFRSTFRDWAAEIAFFPKEVIEHALAHKLKDEAEAAYQRGTLLVKRALLMDQWALFCNDPCPKLPSLCASSEPMAA